MGCRILRRGVPAASAVFAVLTLMLTSLPSAYADSTFWAPGPWHGHDGSTGCYWDTTPAVGAQILVTKTGDGTPLWGPPPVANENVTSGWDPPHMSDRTWINMTSGDPKIQSNLITPYLNPGTEDNVQTIQHNSPAIWSNPMHGPNNTANFYDFQQYNRSSVEGLAVYDHNCMAQLFHGGRAYFQINTSSSYESYQSVTCFGHGNIGSGWSNLSAGVTLQLYAAGVPVVSQVSKLLNDHLYRHCYGATTNTTVWDNNSLYNFAVQMTLPSYLYTQNTEYSYEAYYWASLNTTVAQNLSTTSIPGENDTVRVSTLFNPVNFTVLSTAWDLTFSGDY